MSKSVGLVKGKAPSLQGGAFAGTSISMVNLLKTGIATNGSGELLSTLSQHRYQGSFCQGTGGLIADLMNKDHIRGNLSKYEPDIAATNNAGFTYILVSVFYLRHRPVMYLILTFHSRARPTRTLVTVLPDLVILQEQQCGV